jgi:tetratricopeptide (TPR) repeat protein
MNTHAIERNASEALYATGHRLLSLERTVDALAVFRTLIIVAPDDERGWLGLGKAHEDMADIRTAERLYRVAGRAVPTSTRCMIAHARALQALGDLEEATAALERAADIATRSEDDVLLQLVLLERGRLS